MTTDKSKSTPDTTRTAPRTTLSITAAGASRYGLNRRATFNISADLLCRIAEHALVSQPLTVGSEIRISVELPAILAVEIGIGAHILVTVQRAAYQVVFAPAARNRVRGTLCQDIEVEWDGADPAVQAIGPVYALEHPHLAALELIWHKLREMGSSSPPQEHPVK